MINDNVNATGTVNIVLKDQNGNIKDQRTIPNLVVTVGKNLIASRVTANTSAVMSHMAIGTNATAPDAANTALGTQTQIVALTTAGGVATANVITYAATFGPSSDMDLREAGVFNAASAGTMLCRTIFPSVNKQAADTLSINWQITIN